MVYRLLEEIESFKTSPQISLTIWTISECSQTWGRYSANSKDGGPCSQGTEQAGTAFAILAMFGTFLAPLEAEIPLLNVF